MKYRQSPSLLAACLLCTILSAWLLPTTTFAQCTLNGIQIAEILPDPNGANNHDTDGNGVAATSDEFIKLLNTTGAAVDIGGYELYLEGSANLPTAPFTFPSPTVIAPGGCLTIINAWDDTICPLPADVIESGAFGFSLGNGGDQIALLDTNTSTYISSSYNGDTTATMTNQPPFTTATGLCTSFATDSDGLSIQYAADGSSMNATPTVGGGCGACLIDIISVSAICNGDNAEVTVSFDTNGTSGAYNLTTGAVIVATGTASPIVFTILGPTSTGMVDLVVTDAADASCTATNALNIPACPLAAGACNPTELVISNAVYDTCFTSLGGIGEGNSAVSGEYVKICNTCTNDFDISGWVLGDDATDTTPAMVAGTMIPANECVIIAKAPQTAWEAEYGPVPPGITYIETTTWQTLPNGGDTIFFFNPANTDAASNSGQAYPDVVVGGETIIWDGAAWVAGPNVSLGCCDATLELMATPGPCVDDLYDLTIDFAANFPGDSCTFGVIPDADKEIVITAGGVTTNLPWDATGPIIITGLPANGVTNNIATIGWEAEPACATNEIFAAPDPCPNTNCTIMILSAAAVCIGSDAEVTVDFMTNNTSGSYNISTGGVVVATGTNSPIVFTIAGPTTASTVLVVVADAADPLCSVTNEVAIQDCLQPECMIAITCPPDAVIGCADDSSTNALGAATATITCTDTSIVCSAAVITFSDTTVAGCTSTITRVWMATVDCVSNTAAVCTQIIELVDTDAPLVTLGASTNLGCNAGGMLPPPTLTTTDTCGVVTSGVMAVVTTNGCDVTMVRSAFAMDACGNMGTATQMLTWTEDLLPPVVTLGADTNLGCATMVPPPMLTATDNCSVVTSGVSVVVTTNVCDIMMVRSAFAMDACGNMGVATQILTWTADTEAPVVTLGPDTNLGCNAVVPMPMLTVTDSCTVVTSGVSAVVTTNGCDVMMVRSAFAMDACGNMGTATQTLTWTEDLLPPVVTLGADTNLGCNPVVPMPMLSATDNCSVVTSGVMAVVTTNGCEVMMVRSAFAMDSCDNVGIATQTLTWTIDTDLPVVTLGADTNLGCNPVVPMPNLIVTDSCSVVTSGVSAVLSTNDCEITMVRSAFAIDGCGNMGVATQTLTWIEDLEPPVLNLGASTNLGCISSIFLITGVSDNCAGLLSNDVTSVLTTNGCDIVLVRSGFVIDNCGNMGTATQTLTWSIDSNPPVLSLGSDTNLGCNPASIPMPVLTVTGVCTVVTSGVSAVVTTSGCDVVMVRSAFAENSCGVVGVTTQTLTWSLDNDIPVVTLGPDTNLGCNLVIPAPALTATDSCSIVTSGVMAVVTTNGCDVTMVRTGFALDGCDNVGTATQTITWALDAAPPIVSLGPDTNLGCNAVVPMPVLSITGVCTVVTSGISAVVTTSGCDVVMVRSAFAENSCGVVGVATQIVTWSLDTDTDIPIVTLGPDTNLGCNAVLPPPALVVTDSCTIVTSGVSAVVTTNGCELTMVRSAFAMDACGNMGTATQTLVWTVDTTPPIAALGPDTNLGCNATLPPAQITMSDDCLIVTNQIIEGGFVNGCEAQVSRFLIVEDACGNMGIATQIFTFTVDTDTPVVTLDPSTNLGCNATLPPPNLNATDACGVVTSGVSAVVTTNGCELTMVRSAFAIDSCGNMGTATQTLVWTVDSEPPLVSLGASTNLGCASMLPPPALVVTDSCSVVTSGVSAVVTTNGCELTMVRTAFAMDACGNMGTATQTLVWTADSPPIVSLDPSTNLGCNATLPPPMLVVTGSCNVVTSGVSSVVTTNGCELTMVRSAFAMNACGDMGTATQTLVWTVDTEAPVVTLDPSTNLGCASMLPPPNLSATDTCGVITSGVSAVVTTNGCELTMVRSAFAMDACGNMGTTTQVLVWTVDSEAPIVSLGPSTNLGCNATLPAPNLSATDTCGVITSGVSAVVTTNGCELTMVRSAFAMDACGNMGTATQTLVWTVDTEAPIVSLGASTNLGCASMLPPPTLNATDTCGVMTSGVSAVVTTNGCELTMIRSAFAMDACGNVGTATQVLTWVMDNNPPTITCPTNILVFTNAPGFDLVITESDLGVSATDDCGTPAILASTSVFDCASAGLHTIPVTVVDACGQSASCSVQIEIVCATNVVAPSIGVDIVVDDPGCFCEQGLGSFTVSITNDGPVDLMNVTLTDPLYPACETNLPFLAVGDSVIYMCSVTLTGTVNMVIGSGSANGLTATAMKTVNYAFDATPPTLVSCASNITITCGDPIPPADPASVMGTDDCPTPTSVLVTTNPLAFCAGMGVEYVYQIADACGNLSAPCTQQVIVVDSGGPSFDDTVTDMVLACGMAIPAPEVVGATDACDGTIAASVDMTPIPAGCSARDGMEYVYTATDACGNSISQTQRITFADTTAPTFNRTPTGAMLGCSDSLPGPESLVATDLCAGNTAVDVTTTAIPNSCAALNGVQYVYSATDPCGNNISVTQRFEYIAMDPPVLSMMPASAVLPCGAVVPAALPLTAASCGGTTIPVSLTTEPMAPNCTGIQGTRYTYRATDACGQTVTHVQEYTFADTMPPSLTCGGDQTITGVGSDCMVAVPFLTRSASDSCSTTTITQSPAPGTMHDATQPLVITITAADSCGNQVTCSATYTYECNARITGTAWQDLALDMNPGNDDLSALGLQGIRVTLTDGAGNIIAQDITDPQGGYSFDVPQGTYNVSFNTNDVPANLVTITTPAAGAINVGPGETRANINFGVAPLPTAITLESFTATATGDGVRLDWSTSWEEDNLGYRLWRGTTEGPTEQVDGFILAENQAAAYTANDAATATHYWLEVIDTNFDSEFEAVAWTTVPAAPAGQVTLMLQAEDGSADFTAGASTTALVIGFASEPTAVDADTGFRLGGEVLSVDGSFGVYLSPAAGTRVVISE